MRNLQAFRQCFSLASLRQNIWVQNHQFHRTYSALCQPTVKNVPIACAVTIRNFSFTSANRKSKDRGAKEKKKPKLTNIDLSEVAQIIDIEELTTRFNEVIEELKEDFIRNLSIRSTAGSIETLKVSLDGKQYQVQELAQITRKPKFVILNCAAFPTAIPEIKKAIDKSGLNMNPEQDGVSLICPIPKVTKEHRENLAKNAKAIFIRHRDQMKEIRNAAIKSVTRQNSLSEDVRRRASEHVDALTSKYVELGQQVLKTKQAELLNA